MSRIYIDVANSGQGREWHARLALIVRSVGTTILLWRNRMRDRRALAQMSERELTDIGLCRPQIAGELDKPFWWGVSVATPKGVFDAQPEFLKPKTLMPPAGYSHIAKTNGLPLAFIAGQVSCDASGALVCEGDFRAQVEQTFANLKIAAEAAGGSMSSVIKLNYYCVDSVDPKDQVAVRDVRDKYVNVANPPASTFVVVRRLARPGWLIEIEAIVALAS